MQSLSTSAANGETVDDLAKSLLAAPLRLFHLNVARTLLLMSALMYERDDGEVQMASDYPLSSAEHLLKSEARITQIVS